MCYCEHWQRNFKTATGTDLPRTNDHQNPQRRAYVVWCQQRLFDLWRLGTARSGSSMPANQGRAGVGSRLVSESQEPALLLRSSLKGGPGPAGNCRQVGGECIPGHDRSAHSQSQGRRFNVQSDDCRGARSLRSKSHLFQGGPHFSEPQEVNSRALTALIIARFEPMPRVATPCIAFTSAAEQRTGLLRS